MKSSSRSAARPRILLTNFHPRFSGGHVSSIQRIVTSWLAEHFDFAVAVPRGSDVFARCSEAGVRVYDCDFPGKILTELPSIFKSVYRFRRIVEDFDPCVIHCNGGPDLKIAAWSFPFKQKLKIIRHQRAIKGLGTDPYHRWLYDWRVSANVYVSHEAMRLSHRQGLVPASPCRVIYNGIDTGYFQPEVRNSDLRQSLGIADGDFVFGSCAGTDRYKRVDLFLRAARELGSQYAFKILLLGNAEPVPALQCLAQELGVSDRLIYGGHQLDVRPYLACFDVGFILSDRIETISNAAREMLAMGKPLLSSSFSGLTENFTHGVEGLFVPPGDLPATIGAMATFLQMPKDRLAEMAAAARRRAVDEFDRRVTAVSLQQLYQSLCGDRLSRHEPH